MIAIIKNTNIIQFVLNMFFKSKELIMNANNEISPIEIGNFIGQIREQTGMKQAELAKKITWSPAMLSRIELGDRSLSPDELQIITEAINTPESLRLSEMLRRQWSVLPRPSLNHPDQEILWKAEKTAQELVELSERPDTTRAFQNRLQTYIEDIKKHTACLLKQEHQIAFIGSIGIGKSTAICQLANLIIPNPSGNFDTVLEAGAGGITVCEVHLLTGSEYEIRIETCTDEDVRNHIRDFVGVLLKVDDSQGISKEIERALRNMSGLTSRKEEVDGKKIRIDRAKELAQQITEERDLIIEIMARMELPKRDSRSIAYHSSTGKPPLKWLKDTFEAINNGRHPDFTLPKRIEVVVKDLLLEHEQCSVRVIDTKGIDNQETAARADLENHLRDSHTITVLCSSFTAAPDRNPYQLLERAKDIGVQPQYLELNSSLLVLSRTGEALAVKDDSGELAESVEEGYELKKEQVEMALQPLELNQFPIYFFNAYQDDVIKLKKFLGERLTSVRDSFRNKLNSTIEDSKNLLANQEQVQVQAVIRNAEKRIEHWLKNHETLKPASVHVHDDLLKTMNTTHPRTIRASVFRKGDWYNLNYCHHLGYGSRLLANRQLKQNILNFKDFCKTLSCDAEYFAAQNFIRQAENTLISAFQSLLNKAELTGKNYFNTELASEDAMQLWNECLAENGTGYRDRVVEHNRNWFNKEKTKKLEQDIYILIKKEWEESLNKVRELMEIE